MKIVFKLPVPVIAKLAASLALSLSVSSIAMAADTQLKSTQHDDLASQVLENKSGENTEMLFFERPVTRASFCHQRAVCYQRVQADPQRVQINNAIDPIHFDSARSLVSDKYIAQLEQLLADLSDKQSLQLMFTGHTDSQKITGRLKQRYENNQALSEVRAATVASYVQSRLNLPEAMIKRNGVGSSQPVAVNTSAQGRAQNRRVEISLSYQVESEQYANEYAACSDVSRSDSSNGTASTSSYESKKLLSPSEIMPWRISIDGQPVQLLDTAAVNKAIDNSTDNTTHSADIQRCTDVALEQSQVNIQYDNLRVEPKLSIAAWPQSIVAGETVYFEAWSNYAYWIERSEVNIYSRSLLGERKQLIDTIALDNNQFAQWQAPRDKKPVADSRANDTYWYELVVYDSKGRYDRSTLQPIRRLQTTAVTGASKSQGIQAANYSQAKQDALRSGYGNNMLARQSIPIKGGTVTVYGKEVPADKQVWVMDQSVSVDNSGSFVAEHILPHGLHTAAVSIVDANGTGESFWRDLRLNNNDWFYVGIADLTLAENNTSGDIDLVRQDALLDESSYGRFAFYVKGKLNQRYQLTARLDTEEEPLDKLLDNLHKKDPRSLLRRIDSEDGFATFGDDSKTVDDTPTQGKIYVKVEDERSSAMWGNSKINSQQNELATITRGLYGAHIDYNSESQTDAGEAKAKVELFAADPGTVPARENFLATGGSLYYLRHRDITIGSEQLRVEIRDRESDILLSSQTLTAGRDYSIDSLQGTVLLTRPLSTFSNGSSAIDSGLVRDSSYAGHPNVLVVDYEYVPGFSDPDTVVTGGRASYWLNDGIQVGVTAINENRETNDKTVGGIDITARKSDSTWLKLSSAQSQGEGTQELRSIDGGFGFDTPTLAQDNGKADANRIEFTLDSTDTAIDIPLVVTGYWQEREAGYIGLGQQTDKDIDQQGIRLSSALSSSATVGIEYDERDEDQGELNKAAEIDLSYQINSRWNAAVGVREDQRDSTGSAAIGDRTDAIIKLDYQSEKAWSAYGFAQDTLSKNGSRLENDRIGFGASIDLNKKVSLSGEISDGELGEGARLGVDYQPTEQSALYLNYGLDADEESNGLTTNQGTVIAGAKTRFSDSLSVYAEEKYSYGDQPVGLTQAYGVELVLNEQWTYGLSTELGELNSESDNRIKRKALGLQVGYSHDKTVYASALEFRKDEAASEQRDSWLLRNTLKYQTTPDWRFLARLDIARSDSSKGEFFDGEFVEVVTGYAYRPVENNRWNNLFTYNYLADKTASEQLTASDFSVDFQQRSHVLAADINYDINPRWEIGGKAAFRRSELRRRAAGSDWFRSDAALYVLRADWHVTHKWDFLIEARQLDLIDADDSRSGFLLALYRHMGKHFKLGGGYNFSDFSDDLTDLDYDAEGYFINAVGKF